MKLFNLSTLFSFGILCLWSSTSSTSIAEAKKFAPVSFLVRSQQQQQQQDLGLDVKKNVDTLPEASILSRGGGRSGGSAGGALEETKPSLEVAFSYYLDIAGALLMAGFAYVWGRSIIAKKAGEYPYNGSKVLKQVTGIKDLYFADKVLEEGFCNKNENTQLNCFYVDIFMVVVSYLVAKSRDGAYNKFVYIFAAGYTVFHGLVHFSVKKFPGLSTGEFEPSTLPILGVVLSFIPIIIKTVVESAPKTKDFKYTTPLAVIGWVLATLTYGTLFNKKEYALTYINLVIFLILFGLRSLLIGIKTPEDIEARENMNVQFFGSHFWIGQLATIFVLFIMCSEPLACNGWFGNAGGHVLFEIALYTYLMTAAFT